MNFDRFVSTFFKKTCTPKSVEPLQGDASSRRYFRINMGGDYLPDSLIAMVLPDDPLKSDEAQGGDVPSRLPFVDMAAHLSAVGIRVPAVYLDATSEKVLLIEDLGDMQLLDCIIGADEGMVTRWYEAAATLLARMHNRMWPLPKGSVASTRRFDESLLRWELDHYREWGIEAVFGPLPTDVRSRLDAAFDDFAHEIATLEQGFVHRDYQSRNLMVLDCRPNESSLAVIDFQDGFAGPRIYDLVALLNDSYVTLSSSLKKQMIRVYADARKLDETTLMREFRLVTVQRKLKDGGRFVFIDRVKGNPGYLKFVETSFQRAKEALMGLDGHEALKTALVDADPARFKGII